MKIKSIKEEEKAPSAEEFIEALRASGKKLVQRSIPKPVGFGSGLEDNNPTIDVGQVMIEGKEYTLTVTDLIKIVNETAEQK